MIPFTFETAADLPMITYAAGPDAETPPPPLRVDELRSSVTDAAPLPPDTLMPFWPLPVITVLRIWPRIEPAPLVTEIPLTLLFSSLAPSRARRLAPEGAASSKSPWASLLLMI